MPARYYNPDEYAADSLDADPRADQDIAHWIVDEDGVGRWSDGWTGDDRDDDWCPYEDGDEWLGPPTELDLTDCPF